MGAYFSYVCMTERVIQAFSAVVLTVVVPRSAVSISPRNLLKMQTLWVHPRPTESETRSQVPRHLCFHKCSEWFWYKLKFWNYWLRSQPSSISFRKILNLSRPFCFILCLPRLLTPKIISWCLLTEVKRLFCAWNKNFSVSCSWEYPSSLLLATPQGINVPGDAAAARLILDKKTLEIFLILWRDVVWQRPGQVALLSRESTNYIFM